MSDDGTNPGVMWFTILSAIAFAFMFGGLTEMSSAGSDAPSIAVWIVSGALLALAVFVGSVVGAYYAGRKR